jgi:hypothetical protein
MTEESKAAAVALSVKDRFMIRELFPQFASLTDQIIAQDIDKKVGMSQADADAISLKTYPDGRIEWKEEVGLTKEVDFTKVELDFLDRQIKAKSMEQKISRDMVDTCLKIQKLVKA